jgi:hypothetical protein
MTIPNMNLATNQPANSAKQNLYQLLKEASLGVDFESSMSTSHSVDTLISDIVEASVLATVSVLTRQKVENVEQVLNEKDQATPTSEDQIVIGLAQYLHERLPDLPTNYSLLMKKDALTQSALRQIPGWIKEALEICLGQIR